VNFKICIANLSISTSSDAVFQFIYILGTKLPQAMKKVSSYPWKYANFFLPVDEKIHCWMAKSPKTLANKKGKLTEIDFLRENQVLVNDEMVSFFIAYLCHKLRR
jgi:hypothetical protein